MNREIIFRGLRAHDNKWLFGSLITGLFQDVDTKVQSCNIMDHSDCDNFDCFQDFDDLDTEVITSTVGQFTGLVDKNGVKIFEGDIIKLAHDWDHVGGFGDVHRVFKKETPKHKHYMVRVVEWSGGHHAYFVTNPQRCILDTSWLVEVIGNIHQNPELLEEPKNEL